jgi:hypothetical protein
MPLTLVFGSTARPNRQKWVSLRIVRLAQWVGGLLDKIWTKTDEKNPSILLRALDRCQLLCELLSEFHSFLGRIERVCKQELWYRGVFLGAACELLPDGILLECNQSNSRRHGSRNLRLQYPWIGSGDLGIFLSGFEAARTTPLDTVYTEIEIVNLPSLRLNQA